jgi:hypothetical protein
MLVVICLNAAFISDSTHQVTVQGRPRNRPSERSRRGAVGMAAVGFVVVKQDLNRTCSAVKVLFPPGEWGSRVAGPETLEGGKVSTQPNPKSTPLEAHAPVLNTYSMLHSCMHCLRGLPEFDSSSRRPSIEISSKQRVSSHQSLSAVPAMV